PAKPEPAAESETGPADAAAGPGRRASARRWRTAAGPTGWPAPARAAAPRPAEQVAAVTFGSVDTAPPQRGAVAVWAGFERVCTAASCGVPIVCGGLAPSYVRAMGTVTALPLFHLYGDPPDDQAFDFIHIETIPSRASMHDWTIRAHRHRNLFQILLIEG